MIRQKKSALAKEEKDCFERKKKRKSALRMEWWYLQKKECYEGSENRV